MSDEDAKRVFVSLIACHKEVGRDTGDANKAFMEVYHSVHNEAVFVVEDEAGEIVASCCIFEKEGGFFYGTLPYFTEKWFYVRPDHRDASGLNAKALRLLLREVQMLCDNSGLPCMLRIFNFKRAQPTTALARIAEDFCYYPAGAVVQVSPRKVS